LKKTICFALAAVLLCAGVVLARPGAAVSAAPNPLVNVVLDGTPVVFDVPAQIVNNRTLVPVRGVAEKMDPNADVQWFPDEQKVQIVLPMNGRYAVMYVNNPVLAYGTYHVNDTGDRKIDTKETVTMDSPPTIIGGRTMIPASAVFQTALGGTVNWIAETYTVIITSPALTATPPPTAPPPAASPAPADSGPFVTGDSFEEISAITAQKMYDNNGQFILYYYSGQDASSIQAVEWVKNSARYYGLKVYGVDRDSPYWDNSGNKLSFIWSYLSNYVANVPSLFFVDMQNVTYVPRPLSQYIIDSATDAYWKEIGASPLPGATPAPTGVDLTAHWKQIGLQQAVNMYNAGNKFIYVCYNSGDNEANAYTGIIMLAAAYADADVYVTDFAGIDKNTDWWGKSALGARDFKFPTVFRVYGGTGSITDRVDYLVQPGSVDSLTGMFVNFKK